jgi:hypothetical protein
VPGELYISLELTTAQLWISQNGEEDTTIVERGKEGGWKKKERKEG